jgi:hypothetical protein
MVNDLEHRRDRVWPARLVVYRNYRRSPITPTMEVRCRSALKLFLAAFQKRKQRLKRFAAIFVSGFEAVGCRNTATGHLSASKGFTVQRA